jgi:hypothetical protein
MTTAMEATCQDRSLLDKRPLLMAILVVGLAFGLILSCIRPTFETSDDAVMIGIATGNLGSPQPSEKLVLTHHFVGRSLVELYARAPGLPWYAVCLLATHFLSHAALLWAVLLLAPTRWSVYGFLLYLAVVGVHLVCHFSYTTTSFLAAQSGVAVIFANLSRTTEWRLRRKFRDGVGLFLVFLSCLLRWETCLLVVAFSVPLWAVLLLTDGGRKKVRRVVSVACSALGIVAVTIALDHQAYANDPEWNDYWNLHVDTSRIVDYGRTIALYRRPDQSAQLLHEAGWAPNDFWLLKSWFFFDTSIYSRDKIHLVGQRWSRFQLTSFAENLNVFFDELLGILNNRMAMFSILVIVLHAARKATHLDLWSRRSVWMLAICGTIYLSYFKKLPARILVPILVFAAIQTILLQLFFVRRTMPMHASQKSSSVLRAMGAVAIFFVGGMAVLSDLRFNHAVLQHSRLFWKDITSIERCHAKLVVACSVFPFDVITPYDDVRPLHAIRFFPLSIYQRSPHQRKVLQEAGIENLLQAMRRDPDVLFASVPELNRSVARFLTDHYRVNVRFEPVLKGESGFALYRIREG